MHKIQTPNADEKEQLIDYVCEQSTCTRHEARCLVHAAHVALFPDYVSCLSGAASKIMVVVWHAGPQYHQLFTWQDGRLVTLVQEFLFHAHYREILAEAVKRCSQRR